MSISRSFKKLIKYTIAFGLGFYSHYYISNNKDLILSNINNKINLEYNIKNDDYINKIIETDNYAIQYFIK